MGETVPLSMLTGASHIAESKVLEFLDRAEALGLLRADFEINDETMRFLSKRVLELAYGGINDDRREQLHQQVGAYQEELYQKRLGVSASILAYHFKRSADQERAGRYDRIQTDYRHRAFNAEEAAAYTADPLADEEDEPEDHRLSAESLAKLPNFLRTFLTGVRSIQLYPPGSQPIKKAYQSSMQALRAVLRRE